MRIIYAPHTVGNKRAQTVVQAGQDCEQRGFGNGNCDRRGPNYRFTTPIGTFVNNSSDLIREQITGSRFKDLHDVSGVNMGAENSFPGRYADS